MGVELGDIIAAKLLVQLGWREASIAQTDLIAHESRAGTRDLIDHLEGAGALDPERAGKLRRYVMLYQVVRREALYAGLLEKGQILTNVELDRWKAVLDREGYARPLGDLLVYANRIGRDVDSALRQQQAQGIQRENARLLDLYRRQRYEGVARPITKNPTARVDTGTFTIKNLFRSQESQRLARQAAAEGRDGTGPEIPIPSLAGLTPGPAPRPGMTPGARPRVVSTDRPTLDLGRAAMAPEPARRESVVQSKRPAAVDGYPARIGAYDVERVLGKGGMGVVFLARRPGEVEPVALKLGLSKDDEYRARLRREILATSMLHHENVVQVLDAGEAEDGSPFLVMELVRGRELRELLRERGSFAPRDALAIFVQVLGAAGAAHRAGIVHRDLKPENVLVTEAAGNFLAKVMDFGLAKIVELDPLHKEKVFQTVATDVVSGSPQYLSPEQVLGDAVDARTDLYALGVLLFELLTGVLPYQGVTLGEIVRAHVSRSPRKLADAKPGARFPRELEELVASLLAKIPSERPADAATVIRQIEERVLPALGLATAPSGKTPLPVEPAPDEPRKPRGITKVLSKLQRPPLDGLGETIDETTDR